MNIPQWGLLAILLCSQQGAVAQKLKKSDRAIVANVQAHVNNLSGGKTRDRKGGSAGTYTSEEYISKQFSRAGLKPLGDTNTYYQKFTIYDGKDVLPATFLAINNQKLKLYDDYFPFTFSANKKTEAAVAIALAENGVPWFKDIKELLNRDEDSSAVDTLQLIKKKAISAAEKGASALIVYNSGNEPDILFDKFENSGEVSIPVIYLKNTAFKKHCSDESEIIDISLNVAMQPKSRVVNNIIGFSDSRADSTIIAGAQLENRVGVAALMEVARLVKGAKGKRHNYLFIVFRGDTNGRAGTDYYKQHPTVDPATVRHTVVLDTVAVAQENPKGLHLVKQSVDMIRKY
jgi:hypothetical protein